MDALRADDPPKIGDYLLSGRLGAGGMGEVFFGRSPGGRAVAVKVIYPIFAHNTEFRRRFRLEVEAGRKVGGFHAAQVVDADLDADRPWMVTAYIAGPSLSQVLAQHHALPVQSVRVLGNGLAEALAAIHAAGIIHRDLKPSNILLADDGPRVIDFGIARAIDASGITMRPGTPGFMAPEVLTEGVLTTACDVFALGVVLAFAAGVRPFGDGPPEAIAYRVVHEEPDLKDLPPQIRDLVTACMEKVPARRPTPAQILERFADYDSGGPWLPLPAHKMVTTYVPPHAPTKVANTGPLHHSKLLGEAEQIARAIADKYNRAVALVEVAEVVSRFDRAHAARLLDDALHPTHNAPAFPIRGTILESLVVLCPAELGTVISRTDQILAAQILADIRHGSQVISQNQNVVNRIVWLAEGLASGNPACAESITRVITDKPKRLEALAKVAMVVASTDPVRAEQMTRAITARPEQADSVAVDQDGKAGIWRRRRRTPGLPGMVPKPRTEVDEDPARYWSVRARCEIAVQVTGAESIHAGWLADPRQFVPTIIAVGESPGGTVARAAPAGTNSAYAKQLLAEAEKMADSIRGADLRAEAMVTVRTAAARNAPAQALPLLTEAEQFARTISRDSARFDALEEVALAAARTVPALAEQIARSLRHLQDKVAEIALAIMLTDAILAERIAAAIVDEYWHDFVLAVIAIRTDPANARSLLMTAEKAAHGKPYYLRSVAMVTDRIDPAHAEQIARGMRKLAITLDPDCWEVLALTDLASLYQRTGAGLHVDESALRI